VFLLDPTSHLRSPLTPFSLLDLELISISSHCLFYILKYQKHRFTNATLTSPRASLFSFSNPTKDTPFYLEESQPKMKRIGYLGDNGDHPSSSLLGCDDLLACYPHMQNLKINYAQLWKLSCSNTLSAGPKISFNRVLKSLLYALDAITMCQTSSLHLL
jgi:hypothetical protein